MTPTPTRLLCSALLGLVGFTSLAAETDPEVLFTRGKLEIIEATDTEKRKAIEHKDPWGVKRYRIPHLTRTPQGELVLAIVGRCSVGGDHGKSTTFFARSTDDGATWEYIRHNTDYANREARPKTDFPLTERTQETQVVWYPPMQCYVATYLTKNAAWFTTSKDLRSWTPSTRMSFEGDETLKYWPSPAALQVDPDGSLLFAITGSAPAEEGKTQRFARLAWTKDLKTFEVSPPMPCKGNETAVAPTGDGTYFVTTRISPKRLNMVYDRHRKAWSTPTPFPEKAHWRCEVDVINHDDTLYLTTPTAGRTQGVLYRSVDKGVSWSKAADITAGAFAYSSLVALNANTLAIVSEQENGDIVFQTISLSNLPEDQPE